MMAAVTVVILVGLSIRHHELATDVTPGAEPAPASPSAAPGIPPQAEPPATDRAGSGAGEEVTGGR